MAGGGDVLGGGVAGVGGRFVRLRRGRREESSNCVGKRLRWKEGNWRIVQPLWTS
jgi:hypothetical protein